MSASDGNARAVGRLLSLSNCDHVILPEDDEHEEYETTPSRIDSIASAFARMCVSSLAFLFQRPVRLFRPVHFSTFSLLEVMARRQGKKLGVPYLGRLIRQERPAFLLALVVPPMVANLAIGFTLFQTYTLTERLLDPDDEPFTPTWVVSVAGAAAGAAQCVISAPLDNVRLVVQPLLMHDTGHRITSSSLVRMPLRTWNTIMEAAILPFLPERWYHHAVRRLERLWPSSMGEPHNAPLTSAIQYLPRHLRLLARRKHGMSLLLSLVRDALGFSAFFVSFEWARRLAYHASLQADYFIHTLRHRTTPHTRIMEEEYSDKSFSTSRTVLGRTTAVLVLVCGGAVGALLYHFVSRPVEYIRMVLWHRLYVPQRASGPKRAPRRRPVARVRRTRREHSARGAQRHRPKRIKRMTARPKRWQHSKTLARLMRFARMTAPPLYMSSPVRLFIHTYFLRPFKYPELCKPSAPRPWGTAPPPRHAVTQPWPRQPVRMRWQWIMGRLLSPYACGFFVYAWMSGDLG